MGSFDVILMLPARTAVDALPEEVDESNGVALTFKRRIGKTMFYIREQRLGIFDVNAQNIACDGIDELRRQLSTHLRKDVATKVLTEIGFPFTVRLECIWDT